MGRYELRRQRSQRLQWTLRRSCDNIEVVDPRHARQRRLDTVDVAVVVVLGLFQVALLAVMRATSSTDDGDPFDSTLYGWTWLLLPAVAAIASYLRPNGSRPLVWTAALIVPFVVGVALLGTVWHDPNDGASFWMVGEIFIIVQGLVTLVVASAAAALRGRLDSRR